MKRRSVKPVYLVSGGLLLFVTLVFFTRIIVPVERFSLDLLGATLFRYQQLNGSAVVQNENLPQGSFRVIGKRADEFADAFLIYPKAPRGRRVLFEGNILLGSVVEEGDSASRIQLISSPAIKTPAVFGRSGIPVTFDGKGAGLLEARLPRGSDIEKGDVAYVDDGDIFIVGSVVRIIDIAGDPLITILVEQPVNLTTLSFVIVHGS